MVKVKDCSFVGNIARYGGAISSINLDVKYCKFVGNVAKWFGGAIDSGNLNAKNCRFVGNVAGDSGGAIWADNFTHPLHIFLQGVFLCADITSCTAVC